MWMGTACDHFDVFKKASNCRSSVIDQNEVEDVTQEAFYHPSVSVGLVPLLMLE